MQLRKSFSNFLQILRRVLHALLGLGQRLLCLFARLLGRLVLLLGRLALFFLLFLLLFLLLLLVLLVFSHHALSEHTRLPLFFHTHRQQISWGKSVEKFETAMSSTDKTNIRVAVRLRPLSAREIQEAGHDRASFKVGQKSLTLLDPSTSQPIAAQTYAFGKLYTKVAKSYR